MRIGSFLIQGNNNIIPSLLSQHLPSITSLTTKALILYSLGSDHNTLLRTIRQHQPRINYPVYLAETYGIIGHDVSSSSSGGDDTIVELMERGRGREYGYRGGSGGEGCLVVSYSDDDDGIMTGSSLSSLEDLPSKTDDVTTTSPLLVVADTSGSFGKVSGEVPLHYGGIAKSCFVLSSDDTDNNDGIWQPISYFWIGSNKSSSSSLIGIAAFDGDAGDATTSLLSKIPSGVSLSGDVGLFPCFSRGVNMYDEENVESRAIRRIMTSSSSSSPRIYGMFAHGELGPSSFEGFTEGGDVGCMQHSGTSILTMHTVPQEERDL